MYNRNDLIYIFGERFSDSEYIFLGNEYDSLLAECNSKLESKTLIIENICLKRLELYRIVKDGNITIENMRQILIKSKHIRRLMKILG